MSHRNPIARLYQDELIVDSFAGGGGASLGIEMALERSPDIAINHDAEAIAMHAANHPETKHYCESVWDVDPRQACGGRPVGLAWFSPDCKHFSKAKGGKPVEKKIRGLAWIVIKWAKLVRPRIIILENVEEFADWGPLLKDGRPCPIRRGVTFRRWMSSLRQLGYAVESRELRASDYGAPTSRKRLFVVARCDDVPIAWPEPTHGPGRTSPWRVAAECIQWSEPCPSIFERGRPLAENTQRRIARGIWRYVLNTKDPFIVPSQHSLLAPALIATRNGERDGQAPRVHDILKPYPTVTGIGSQGGLVAALLARHYGGHENDGGQLSLPIPTITTKDHHALVATHMLKLHGTCADGQPMSEPAPTIRAQGTHLAEVRAFLVSYYGQGIGQQLALPLRSVTTHDRFGLVTVAGIDYAIADIGMRMLIPRELFRAQGFPDSYIIEPLVGGRPMTKTAQVRMCGNSVCPPLAAALARAQVTAAGERIVA